VLTPCVHDFVWERAAEITSANGRHRMRMELANPAEVLRAPDHELVRSG
jgi:hypothetical protein